MNDILKKLCDRFEKNQIIKYLFMYTSIIEITIHYHCEELWYFKSSLQPYK